MYYYYYNTWLIYIKHNHPESMKLEQLFLKGKQKEQPTT